MKKTALFLILTIIISLLPALSVSAEGEEYYLKGIYDGATVVVQAEPTKTVTLIDVAKSNYAVTTATDVSKVVFTFNDNAPATVSTAPFSYTMEFDNIGQQTLKYDVYKTGNSSDTPDETKTITFTALAGKVSESSFGVLDFEGMDALEAKEAIRVTSQSRSSIATALKGTDTVLKLHNDNYGGGTNEIHAFEGARIDSGSKVHIYEFDIATYYNYTHRIHLSDGATKVEVLTIHQNTTLDGSTKLFPSVDTFRKIRMIVDYNGTPTASIYVNGKELKRLDLTDKFDATKTLKLCFGIHNHTSSNPIYIDDFSYTAYDVALPQSFSGASIVGGEDKPVLETISGISFMGTDYLLEDGTDVTSYVTISEKANTSDGDFTESSVNFTAAINGSKVDVAFPDGLSIGTTYKVAISGIKDSYYNYYIDYDFTFRTLNEGENPLPEVTLTSPTADERYYPNESTITLTAEAFDTLGGAIEKVEFFADGELIGEGVNTEGDIYTYEWVLDDSIDSSEPVAITAKAVDNEGGISETFAVNIVIWSRQLPEITITSPEIGTSYSANLAGVDLEIKPTIEFTAEDIDGTITDINIWFDGTCIQSLEDLAATSYTFTDAITEIGEHTIIVEVYDNDGQSNRDDITINIAAKGKAGVVFSQDNKIAEYFVDWDKKGTATFKPGTLTDYADVKGIIISSTDSTASSLSYPIDTNLTDTSFAMDIKVAFNDTSSKRVIKLGNAVLVTFNTDGTYTGGGTYYPGQVYNISAVADAEHDLVYGLVNGVKVSQNSASYTYDPIISVGHEGVGETAILSANASKLGDAVEPTVNTNGNSFTVDFPAGVDESTIKGNVSMMNLTTGKAVALKYAGGVFTVEQKISVSDTYEIVVLPDARDINGNGYCGTYRTPFVATSTAEVAKVTVEGGALNDGTYTATLDVTFRNITEEKSVYLVYAAYNGAKMVDHCVVPVTAPATASDIPLSLSGVDAGTVIEAFVVDSMDDLNSVTDRIIVIK